MIKIGKSKDRKRKRDRNRRTDIIGKFNICKAFHISSDFIAENMYQYFCSLELVDEVWLLEEFLFHFDIINLKFFS